jgi:hypothetical protein
LKKIKLLLLVCIALVSLSACSKDNAQPQSPSLTPAPVPTPNTVVVSPSPSPTPTLGPVVVGTSSSCDIAPKQLTLAGKTFHLSDNATSEEGPMKLAYIKCEKGTFTMGEPDDAFVIFSAGKTNDIYLAGGRTEKGFHQFYSLEEATQPSANQKSGK